MNNSPLNLLGAPSEPWAITQAAFDELQRITAAVRFESSPTGGLQPMQLPESFLRFEVKDTANANRPYEVVEGIALLPLHGVITKRESFWTYWYGGTSADRFRREFLQAVADDEVEQIVLDVDSPGGQIPGVSECATAIYQARGIKPITAVANELMASAAVWIASSADEIVTPETGNLGSVGVIRNRLDFSAHYAELGIAEHQIKSGTLKGIGDPMQPMNDAELAHWQSRIDYLFGLFVSAVSRNRNMPTAAVLENMGDARLLIGQQAVDAGLADRVGTLDAELETSATPTHFSERLTSNAQVEPLHNVPRQQQHTGHGSARFIRQRRN